MEINKVYLSNNELQTLRRKRFVSSGTQAEILNYGGGLLYKVYYRGPYVHYYEKGIKEAIKRQPNVKHTSLPRGIIYVDGEFRGCVLKSFLEYDSIFKASNLDKKHQYEVLKTIINEGR